jgi:alpha-D-ribose 1-methylphosphonate 5-triphosphate diphosphatase
VNEPTEYILTHARLVLADSILDRGWVAVSDGKIADFGEGDAPEKGLNLHGDTLIPGLVELHTDHLEAHFSPRPNVFWNPLSAVLAYDAQIAASGITTVFDSLRVGQDSRKDGFSTHLEELADAITLAQTQGALRAQHFTHLRCEICSPDVIEKTESFVATRPIHLMSLNDHTPGQRQFRDINKWLDYYRGKTSMSEAQLQDFIGERVAFNREFGAAHHDRLVEIARAHKVSIASHDDTTLDHVAESIADGASLAEFPTTIEAAAASHAAGICVMMGAPNIVRGGSHSGNVSATELARRGTLDVLSSDYVPTSLLMAAWMLPELVPSISLPDAMRMVTKTPAQAANLHDRGEIAIGQRADLVRVVAGQTLPIVRNVWTGGLRVA